MLVILPPREQSDAGRSPCIFRSRHSLVCLLHCAYRMRVSEIIAAGKDPCPNIHKWAAVVVQCPSNWGWWFLLFCFLSGGVYVGGFALHSHKVKGVPLSMNADLLPHAAFWAEVRSLVEDGVVFTKARVATYRSGGAPSDLLVGGGAPSVYGAAAAEGAPAAAPPAAAAPSAAADASASESEDDSLVE